MGNITLQCTFPGAERRGYSRRERTFSRDESKQILSVRNYFSLSRIESNKEMMNDD